MKPVEKLVSGVKRIRLREWEWLLLPQKAAFLPDKKILLISDPHFGKAAHFRKSGIAIPAVLMQQELSVLDALIHQYLPDRLIVLGDMFHSDENEGLKYFSGWRDHFQQLQITLIRGNHDILQDEWYVAQEIELFEDQMALGPFLLVHDPAEIQPEAALYPVCGHIHPAVRLHGGGGERLRLPCFHFSAQHALMPAFGKFTGTYAVRPEPDDMVYVIAGEAVIRL